MQPVPGRCDEPIPTRLGPDFIIIGAAKSGTTTLYHYLIQHPEIFMVAGKEPSFFSDPRWRDRGLDWYASLFAEAATDQVRGEASTTYTRRPHTEDAPARIAECYPQTKFIYIMRHPVERAYSHYAHHMRGGVTMSFEEAIDRDAIYLDCSRYRMQIERYQQYFPDERFLFLLLDDLSRTPSAVLNSCFRFLQVEPRDIVQGTQLLSNSDREARTTHHLNEVSRNLRAHPVGRMARRVIPRGLRHLAYHGFRKFLLRRKLPSRLIPPPMQASTRQRLVSEFAAENTWLGDLLKRDLSAWNE